MMTPKEGSKLCIRMAGYGIREDVVKAIQDDARADLLEEIERLQKIVTRYETKDFCAGFRDSVRSSVTMALDCALDHPHLMAEPDSFNDIESLAERIAVHNYKAHGKDGFEVNTCPSCGAFMNISMKREYYMQ